MNYVATDSDIEKLTEDFLSAQDGQGLASSTYLQFLVGTTQNELKAGNLSQFDVFAQVSARFYAAVLRKAITPDIADEENLPAGERKRRAKLRNRKTNWARSNKSTLNRWMRVAGNDIRTLDAESVTKDSLRVESANPRAPSVKVIDRLATRVGDTLVKAVDRMENKREAVPALQELLSRISGTLSDLGIEPAKRAETALREKRPFTVRGHYFWPMNGTTQ